jgi:MFS family permease
MMFIDAMLQRVSLRATLVIGILGMSGLWLSFALLTGATLLIPLMVIRGTFYTFQSVGISLLVSKISHPVNVATNQSLALVTIPGLAVLLTGPISGWIFDNLGSRVLFEVVAILGILSAIVLMIGKHYLSVYPAADAPAEVAEPQLETQP